MYKGPGTKSVLVALEWVAAVVSKTCFFDANHVIANYCLQNSVTKTLSHLSPSVSALQSTQLNHILRIIPENFYNARFKKAAEAKRGGNQSIYRVVCSV